VIVPQSSTQSTFLEHYPLSSLASLRATIEEVILPIRDQMQTLNTNFDEVARNAAEASSLRNQIALLTNEVATLRMQASRNVQLEAEVNMLKDHIASLREMSSLSSSHTRTESNETTGKASTSGSLPVIPGSSVLLGKRHRSPNDSSSIGLLQSGQEGDIDENELLRPSKKRPKLSPQGDAVTGSSRANNSRVQTPIREAVAPATGPSSTAEQGFTIYNGPEVIEDEDEDPPPPTSHLSELFATPGPSAAGPLHAGDQSIARNTAFTFTFPESGFHPITSTPVAQFGTGPMPTTMTIPYPEPPTSPTPSPERGRRAQPFGSPLRSPVRPHRATSRQPSVPPIVASSSSTEQPPQFITPTALTRTPPLPSAPEPPTRGNNNNQASLGIGIGRPRSSGIGMGPVALPLPMPPDTPAPPMKRTMYGTELDADSRFGDFGQDGIAMGFWTGVTPRF